MPFKLRPTAQAAEQLAELERDGGKAVVLNAVRRALAKLEADPRHPGLHVHARQGETCAHGKTLFQAYAQNQTPGAYRIFFCYCLMPGDERGTINVIAIIPHP